MRLRLGRYVCGLVVVVCVGCGGSTSGDGGGLGSGVDATLADLAGVGDAGVQDVGVDGAGETSVECGSLLAARVMEMQMEGDADFPRDCDAPFTLPIGAINSDGDPMCLAGESANACRERVYETPPAMSTLNANCWKGAATEPGCLRGKYLPRCADGTDTGCATPEVVCQDGTRPMVYVEPGAGVGSNDWVFYMGGEGDPCQGKKCWLNYRFGKELIKDAYEKAVSSTHPEHQIPGAIQGGGIMNGEAGPPTSPFASFNRVKWNRCSDTASDGVETVSLFDADLDGEEPVLVEWGTAPVWHRGFDVWRGLFHSLTTTAGRDVDGDGVADLPTLGDAETVLIGASSDASLWVIYAADRLRSELQAIAGPEVDVRVVLDGYFNPMLDSIGRYDESAPDDFDMLSHSYEVTGLCTLPNDGDSETSEACSDMGYAMATLEEGDLTWRGDMEARSTLLDVSCEAHHGAGAAPCYDHLHNVVHHLETPVFVLADQEDSTIGGVPVPYADVPGYTWPAVGIYRQGVLDQAYDIRDHWGTAAREDGAGVGDGLVMLLRKSRRGNQAWAAANHVHLGDDVKMSWQMTLCTAAGDATMSVSSLAAVYAWATSGVPATMVAEDAAAWDGSSPYWVTGGSCVAPE